MKNKLTDLNDHLFAQLERLSDEELAGDRLIEEISRAKAVTEVATSIISNGGLLLRAKVAEDNFLDKNIRLPKILEG